MIKFFFVLLILILVGGLIALRYRKQIQLGLYFLRMLRQMRRMNKNDSGNKQIEVKPESADSMLVQCAGCKSWISENKALKIGSKSFYCSASCMEKSVKMAV